MCHAQLEANIMDTDKAKNIGTPPDLRAYWFVVGTLFVVLVFMLRYPVHIITYWVLNPIIYGTLTLGLITLLWRFVQKYSWQHSLVIILISCVLLSGWQTITSPSQSRFDEYCTVINEGMLEKHYCAYVGNCPTMLLQYITISGLPFAIETLDYYENPCLGTN
jgi:hypothetical protein